MFDQRYFLCFCAAALFPTVCYRPRSTQPQKIAHIDNFGLYQVLDSSFNITANVPHNYTGSLNMKLRVANDGNRTLLWAHKSVRIIASRYRSVTVTERNMGWRNLTVTTDSFGFSEDAYLVTLQCHRRGEVFIRGSTYTVEVTFVGAFTLDKNGFYVSKYQTGGPDKLAAHYAVLAIRNMNIVSLIIPAGEQADRTTLKSVSRYSIHLHQDSLMAGYKVLTGSRDLEKSNKIILNLAVYIHGSPSFMYSYFISQFDQIARNISSYALYYPQGIAIINGENVAVDTGYRVLSWMVRYFNADQDLFNIKCIVLPDFEPNVIDTWGMIYYQGASTFDGTRLDQLLLVFPSLLRGHYAYANYKISTAAIHETLLLVAKVHIDQCFGDEWILRLGKKRYDELTNSRYYEDSYSGLRLHFALVDFLAYRQIEEIYPNFRSMDMMYLDFMQPYLWQNMYSLETETETPQIYNRKCVSLLRMYYDFDSRKEPPVETQNPNRFLSFIRSMRIKIPSHQEILKNIDNRMVGFFENTTESNAIKWFSYNETYPVVHIKYNEPDGRVDIFQRFINGTPSAWNIPIVVQHFQGNKAVSAAQVLLDSSATVTFYAELKKDDWILANPGQSVMYRVCYPGMWLKKLIARLQMPDFGGIHYTNRAQLMDDLMEMVVNGMGGSLQTVFSMFRYLHNETELLPWSVAYRHLKFLHQKITGAGIRNAFQMFVAHLTEPLYGRLGIHDGGTDESLSVKKLRNIIIDLACMTGNMDCIENVYAEMEKVTSDLYRELEVNTRDAICCTALRRRSETFFKLVVSRIVTTPNKLENLDWDRIYVDLNRIKDPDELGFYARCISCCTIHQFHTNYARIFFQLAGKKNDLRLQESFRENTNFTARQLLGGSGLDVMRRETKVLNMAVTFRWFLVAANQVRNKDDSLYVNKVVAKYPSEMQAEVRKVANKMVSISEALRGSSRFYALETTTIAPGDMEGEWDKTKIIL